MMRLCECGCGQPAPIATTTNTARGWVKGQPRRFIHGHRARLNAATIRDRLLAKAVVDPAGPRLVDDSPCWEFTGRTGRGGYAQIGINGRNAYVHRVAYELWFGPIPGSGPAGRRGDGLDVDHLCRNRICVNPAHLEAVTLKTNTLRGQSPSAVNAAKTHCDRGHPFDEANTIVRANGHRGCRTCRNVDHAEHRRAYERARWPRKKALRKAREERRSNGAAGVAS